MVMMTINIVGNQRMTIYRTVEHMQVEQFLSDEDTFAHICERNDLISIAYLSYFCTWAKSDFNILL